LADERALGQCCRAAALAGQAHVSARLRTPAAAGRVGADQALGGTSRPSRLRHLLREAGAVIMEPITVAPFMFAGLVIFLLIGYPVAFSLSAVGLAFAFFGIEANLLEPSFLNTIPLRLYGIMSNDLLLAIPFFTLMGAILERSRLAED